MDVRGLLSGEQLLRCSKGDAPFEVMTIAVITQPINNYNNCHANSSLTSTMLKHPLCSWEPSCVHIVVGLRTRMKGEEIEEIVELLERSKKGFGS
ncbi:hypothetical protein J1N35_013948 [Gossypium stocksii]|uniref:Uncharacterized protein n=1 Tax=Gossypium stocksii TaxID=47602 RepID=A0A9D4A9G4_9ROSI|nr:hypothetical protein J1N35_013948 [Gossypium stocksii]